MVSGVRQQGLSLAAGKEVDRFDQCFRLTGADRLLGDERKSSSGLGISHR